jgi:hypothetical protein
LNCEGGVNEEMMMENNFSKQDSTEVSSMMDTMWTEVTDEVNDA